MRIKEATIKTSIITFLGVVVLGGLAIWGGSEGGPAAQGALVSLVAILPILFFTSVVFPIVATLMKKRFTKIKWVGFNLAIVLLVALPLSIVLNAFAGGGGGFIFIFSSVVMIVGLIIPSYIWLRIATPKN